VSSDDLDLVIPLRGVDTASKCGGQSMSNFETCPMARACNLISPNNQMAMPKWLNEPRCISYG
jgi:hypothetical protein